MTVAPKTASTAKSVAPATKIDSLLFPYQLSSESKTFLEDLVVCVGGASETVEVSDDLKLESYFQRQALCAAVAAKAKILALGRVFWKPPTHHVHLLKTSAHLARVASAAAKDADAAKSRETARLQRALKKDGKAVQQRTLAERNAEKRETLRAVDALKKRSNPADRNRAGAGEDEFDVQTAVEDIIHGRNGKASSSGGMKKSQAWRDSKYGFGGLGQGRGKGKGNDKGRKGNHVQDDSRDHTQTGSRGKHRDARPGPSKARSGPSKTGKKVAKRPGKGRRQAMRNRSRK